MSKRSLKKKNNGERYFDYSLFFVIVFIACFGIIMIYSSSYYTASLTKGDGSYYAVRQAKILAFGILWMLFVSKLDYHGYTKFWFPLWLLAGVLMVLTDFTPLGKSVNGARRWIGYGDHTLFQTSEIVKVAVIVAMAVFITSMHEILERWQAVLITILLVIPIDVLVAKENLSAGIIIAGIAFAMYFVASRAKKIFLACAVLAGVFVATCENLVAVMLNNGIIKPYQAMRILVWKNPQAYSSDGGFQVLQGLYAIGSGGFFGKGLGNSTQKLSFLPEAQNDMIFSVICEELGLFGAVCVILLFLFMLYRFLVIANNAPDMLGSMLTVGVMAHIALQVLMNIAVVTNLMPNTGISLPLISYGGTSMIFLLTEMGMVLGVSRQIPMEQ